MKWPQACCPIVLLTLSVASTPLSAMTVQVAPVFESGHPAHWDATVAATVTDPPEPDAEAGQESVLWTWSIVAITYYPPTECASDFPSSLPSTGWSLTPTSGERPMTILSTPTLQPGQYTVTINANVQYTGPIGVSADGQGTVTIEVLPWPATP